MDCCITNLRSFTRKGSPGEAHYIFRSTNGQNETHVWSCPKRHLTRLHSPIVQFHFMDFIKDFWLMSVKCTCAGLSKQLLNH